MKRSLFVILANCIVLCTFAQLNGDGYYRVKNVASGRYITVKDNRGSINITSTTADMGAVHLYRGFDMIETDPGSILYIDNVGDDNYKFHAQGTDTYQIIGYYLRLKLNSDGSYKAYQGNSMMVMYLGDGETSAVVDSRLVTNAKGKYRDWYVLPVSSSSSDNYFGVKPEVKVSDAYYTSFYASFPFSTVSDKMKVYYIDKVDKGMAVYKEVSNGIVPPSAPVFIKCVSDLPSENRLNIASNDASSLSSNKLSGVYFCNKTNDNHRNLTAYNAETMRVLGTTSDGKLAYVKADIEYLPANKSYLTVPAGSPDVITVVSEEEYNQVLQEQQKTYTVTFKVGDEVISSQALSVGDAIVVPEAPAKEGYTFSGWGEVPATMPAQDLTFEGTYTLNSYTVVFKIGTEVISSESLSYGAPIVAPDVEKEGHTLEWPDLLATVPAYNVTFYGRYIVNTYTLLYVVDGKEYQRRTMEYGAEISLIAAPEKEGYTFSGWSEAPKTMPANDVTITGLFTVNVHTVYYYVGDELVHTDEVAYGEPIPSYEYVPTTEGETFLGWLGETHATMPDNDLTYTANIESGIDAVVGDSNVDIYTVTGVKVMSNVVLEEVESLLKRGIYIINGRKMIIE